MQLQKENYLQIKYESKKGLLLNWNFKDLYQLQNYYHHLLILANPRDKVSQNLIQQYYRRMKFGDLIGVVYYHHTYGPRSYNWVEKTQLAHFQSSKLIERITKEELQGEQLDALIRFAADFSLENRSSNLVCNFLLSEEHRQRADEIVGKVMAYRQEGAFPYHCTFFNLFWYNKISFNSGVHFLNTETKEIFQVLSLYHSVINNATVRQARVVIECSNGQMLSYDAHIWKNTEFNRIQRTFYGPSINYQEDVIQFHVLDVFEDAEFDMSISLELELFSGQLVSGSKRLKLSFPNERHYDKSLNLTVPEPVMTFQGVELKNNPFGSTTFVRLMKSAFHDLNDIKEKLEVACRTRRTRQRPAPNKCEEKERTTRPSTKRRPMEYFYPNQESEETRQQFSS